MMTIVSFLVFAAAFAAVVAVFAFTLLPAVPRIAALLRGEADPAFADRPMLVLSEARVRTRARSAVPARRPALRAAA